MKRTENIFDAIIAFPNLWRAAHKAWRGKKDKTRIADFYFNLERELLRLQEELIANTYHHSPYRVFMVTDPKRRKIAAADFRDRVVYHAIVNVLDAVHLQQGMVEADEIADIHHAVEKILPGKFTCPFQWVHPARSGAQWCQIGKISVNLKGDNRRVWKV